MSIGLQGTREFLHRARLLPLPILAPVARPPCTRNLSARIRHRLKLQRHIVAVTNRCICTLNRLYSAPSTRRSRTLSARPLHRTAKDSISTSQPDNIDFSCPCCRPSDRSSSAQRRVLALLRERCAAFVLQARTWTTSHPGPTCDIGMSVLDALVELSKPSSSSSYQAAGGRPLPSPATSGVHHADMQDSLPQMHPDDLALPSVSAFSSASTTVVPLMAERISLPKGLKLVPMLGVLPPDVAARYTEARSSALLRPAIEVLVLNYLRPLKPPRVAGSRAEYVRLIRRMVQQGMISFTSQPKAVNGVFAVAKDDNSDRLIIDAQPCNRLFVDSPHVALPGPSHLVQMQVPTDATMMVGKSDLSDYYHHYGLPEWMWPYFALPPLTPTELASIGAPMTGACYPMCLTLAMGFSHAVYIAQAGHEHIVYSSGALSPEDSLLRLTSPTVSSERVVHGIVIDDFFLFSLNRELATRTMQRVLSAYRTAGFVVKESKLVMPTSAPVKVLGLEVDGRRSSIRLPSDSQFSLVRATLAALRSYEMTGRQLAHLIGRWTWVMMLRRPTLAILQHVYRFCRLSQSRRFRVWMSVRRELGMLLSMLPLLTADLRSPFFHRAFAADASEVAGGVVSAVLTPHLATRLWPLCSTRHHAVQQAIDNADRLRPVVDLTSSHRRTSPAQSASFEEFYDAVDRTPWRTIISQPWREDEHINCLELRAALLAVHRALSSPSAISSRVFLLVDSTVAFFSLWKGRSSSPALLLILRKISALLLAGGLSLLPGWVPSALNPADAPSRLHRDHHDHDDDDDCPTSGRVAA